MSTKLEDLEKTLRGYGLKDEHINNVEHYNGAKTTEEFIKNIEELQEMILKLRKKV